MLISSCFYASWDANGIDHKDQAISLRVRISSFNVPNDGLVTLFFYTNQKHQELHCFFKNNPKNLLAWLDWLEHCTIYMQISMK